MANRSVTSCKGASIAVSTIIRRTKAAEGTGADDNEAANEVSVTVTISASPSDIPDIWAMKIADTEINKAVPSMFMIYFRKDNFVFQCKKFSCFPRVILISPQLEEQISLFSYQPSAFAPALEKLKAMQQLWGRKLNKLSCLESKVFSIFQESLTQKEKILPRFNKTDYKTKLFIFLFERKFNQSLFWKASNA